MKWNQVFMKQDMMRRVIISLLPIVGFAVYLFGWRVLTLLGVVTLAGVFTEHFVFARWYQGKQKVSEAVLVTCLLFTLTLHPTTPYWVAVIGIVFGVFFAKGIFGGFGKNVFNPALIGRCFIFISFPAHLTMNWPLPFSGFPGGFSKFSPVVDAVSHATPLRAFEGLGEVFFGITQGSIGETSALLILLAACYLLFTKTASLQLMASSFLGFLSFAVLFFGLGSLSGNPVEALFSGGFLFGTVFMVTDPITAPRNKTAQILFGFLIGALTISIRVYGNFTEGMMFAILIGNTFSPLIERNTKIFLEKKAKLGRKQVAS